jgi:hypothetical protein
MSAEQVAVQGTVLPDGSLQLNHKVGLLPGPVEVIVRSVPAEKKGEGVMQFLARIRAEQAASGYVPRSAEQIDADLREIREGPLPRDARSV